MSFFCRVTGLCLTVFTQWAKSDFFPPHVTQILLLSDSVVLVLNRIRIHFLEIWPQSEQVWDLYQNSVRLLCRSTLVFIIIVQRLESETKPNIMVKSSPRHPEMLDEICFTDTIHIRIPSLLAPTLHPHTPLSLLCLPAVQDGWLFCTCTPQIGTRSLCITHHKWEKDGWMDGWIIYHIGVCLPCAPYAI